MGLWGFGKKALNSTIGTPEEKPLDYISKNVFMHDGYYYKRKIEYTLSSIVKSVGTENTAYSYIDAMYISSVNDTFVYFKDYVGATEYHPACLSIKEIDRIGGFMLRPSNYIYVSEDKLKAIVCDNYDETVYFAGTLSTNNGVPTITKFRYDLWKLAEIPMQADNSLILVDGEGSVYDIDGYNGASTTTLCKIKKYTSNLSLINTHTIPNVCQIYRAEISDGFLYAVGRLLSPNVTALIKIDLSTMSIVSYIENSTEENGYNFYSQFTLDSEYLYCYGIQKLSGKNTMHLFKFRKSNLELVDKLMLDYSLRQASWSNEKYCGASSGQAFFISDDKKRVAILDTAKMQLQTYTPVSGIKGLTAVSDRIYTFNYSSQLTMEKLTYVFNGIYERVTE